MVKTLAAGITALLIMASPPVYAQATSEGRLSTADLAALTDMRVDVVKAALQLTPDQEKYWPAIEKAIRDRAKNRQARLAEAAKRAAERRDSNAADTLGNRNPVDFMRRRAAALEQRGADLKRLADTWEPLYQTLNPVQKKRVAVLALVALRDVSDVREQRRTRLEDSEQD